MPELKLVTPRQGRSNLNELLSPRELRFFHGLKNEKRKRDWLAGRIAAKELLRAHLGRLVPLEEIELYSAAGVPRFRLLGHKLSELLNISIAHSHGHGLCGLARTQEEGYIGVDIERIRPLSTAVQRRFLSQAEMEALRADKSLREGAVLFWTLKEAALKALRLKVCKLKSLQVDLQNGKAVILYKPEGSLGQIKLSAAYWQHADFFLAWALVQPLQGRV